DTLRISGHRRATEVREGRVAVDALTQVLRAWVGQIEALRIIDGFAAGDYSGGGDVPDDVITDAGALLEMLATQEAASPGSIPFAEALIADISARLEVARTEWREAESATSEHRQL